MPAFCHFYPALRPDDYYNLDDDDRTAMRAFMAAVLAPKN